MNNSRFALDQYLPHRILIVEDEKSIQSLIQATFKEHGVPDIYCTPDGEAAWQQLQDYDYELLILDWNLPVMGGLQLFNRIRQDKRLRYLPTIVVSGMLEKSDIALIGEYFFSTYIMKPFDEDRMVKMAKDLLRDKLEYEKIALRAEQVYFDNLDHNLRKPAEILETWSQNLGQNPAGVTKVATILKSLHGIDLATQMISQALRIHPESPMLLHNLAVTQVMAGSLDAARINFLKALKNSPHNVEGIFLLGALEIHVGTIHKGINLFKKAIAIDPGGPVSQRLEELIKYIHQIQHFKIDELENGLATVLHTLAQSKLQDGHYKDMQWLYERALLFTNIRKARAKVYYNLGICQARLGNRSEAVSNFFRSMDLIPGYGKPVDALQRFGYDFSVT